MTATSETYKEFINKSINWCNKLHQEEILTNDQLDKCIANVNGANSSYVPPILDIPRTGIAYNYGIYDVNISKFTKIIDNTKTNINYITNNKGSYLAEKPDGTLYFVNNIDESKSNQMDVLWTLIEQTDSQHISILSPHDHYLIANSEYSISSNGTAIGPASLWLVTSIDNSIILSSSLYPNHYLNYNPNLNKIELSLKVDKSEYLKSLLDGSGYISVFELNSSNITTSNLYALNFYGNDIYGSNHVIGQSNILINRIISKF
jgi:hypothetical protein